MPTINVYVSAELKARMVAVGKDVKWSEVAQEAFLRFIQSEEWKLETDRIERAAARFRGGKADLDKANREEGAAAGRNWAIDRAAFDWLQKLEQWHQEIGVENYDLDDRDSPLPGEISELLVDDRNDLWEELTGERNRWPSSHYVAGFIEGALEAFDEIKDRM